MTFPSRRNVRLCVEHGALGHWGMGALGHSGIRAFGASGHWGNPDLQAVGDLRTMCGMCRELSFIG